MRLHEGRVLAGGCADPGLAPRAAGDCVFRSLQPGLGIYLVFNTESWATGVYQKMTELRVDPWRVAMIDAVTRAYAGEATSCFGTIPASCKAAGTSAFSSSAIPEKAILRNIRWSRAISSWDYATT